MKKKTTKLITVVVMNSKTGEEYVASRATRRAAVAVGVFEMCRQKGSSYISPASMAEHLKEGRDYTVYEVKGHHEKGQMNAS